MLCRMRTGQMGSFTAQTLLSGNTGQRSTARTSVMSSLGYRDMVTFVSSLQILQLLQMAA